MWCLVPGACCLCDIKWFGIRVDSYLSAALKVRPMTRKEPTDIHSTAVFPYFDYNTAINMRIPTEVRQTHLRCTQYLHRPTSEISVLNVGRNWFGLWDVGSHMALCYCNGTDWIPIVTGTNARFSIIQFHGQIMDKRLCSVSPNWTGMSAMDTERNRKIQNKYEMGWRASAFSAGMAYENWAHRCPTQIHQTN